jgi:hypothetical protein
VRVIHSRLILPAPSSRRRSTALHCRCVRFDTRIARRWIGVRNLVKSCQERRGTMGRRGRTLLLRRFRERRLCVGRLRLRSAPGTWLCAGACARTPDAAASHSSLAVKTD